jgi:hypothetical protein
LGSNITLSVGYLSNNDMLYGKRLIVGEARYWMNGQAFDLNWQPWENEELDKHIPSWREMHEFIYQQAIDHHCQTLDLREPGETRCWTTVSPDLVKNFIVKAGYRFHPVEISLPLQLKSGKDVSIAHKWKNTGNGYLPNNLPNWNYKYKPAFALLDGKGNPVKVWVDENAEPSEWLSGADFSYQLSIRADSIPRGAYQWAVAIVDKTKSNTPGIKLAVENKEIINGWTVISSVTVK